MYQFHIRLSERIWSVLSGAAGYAASLEYEEHLRKQGQPETQEKMKASLFLPLFIIDIITCISTIAAS